MVSLNSDIIIKKIEKNKKSLSKLKVKRIGLFGSYLKGTQNKQSDIDFIVVFEDETFDNYMDLKFFLEGLFKKKVDLVIKDNIKPALEYIKEDAKYARV